MSSIDDVSLSDWRAFLEGQRWYGAKGRDLAGARVLDAEEGWVLLEVALADGSRQVYQLPGLRFDAENRPAERLAGADLPAWLGEGLREGRRDLRQGELVFARAGHGRLELQPAGIVPGEMSNTLLALGTDLLVKVYRRVEPGVHPEVEALEILSGKGFPHTPAVHGTVSYHPAGGQGGAPTALMLLLEQIPDATSLWEIFTGGSSSDRRLEGLARELGRVTAALHRALQEGRRPPAPATAGSLPEDPAVLDELARALPALTGRSRELAEGVIARTGEILDRLGHRPPQSNRPVRIHGDHHLGQVVREGATGRLVILDFEGEPALPLAARRVPAPAARDLACVLRSFTYARQWGERERSWEERMRRGFLAGYLEAAAGAPFLPSRREEFGEAIRYYELQKALAEIGYELTHRPDWVRLPLEAIPGILVSPIAT